jgi:membrane associated rhomboid family serine protease
MAANEYYNPRPPQSAPTDAPYPEYYSSTTAPYPTSSSPYSTSAYGEPSSSYLAPSAGPSKGDSSSPSTSQQGKPGTSPSPFDTVFDDHAYPASTHQPTPASSMHRLSHYQDTAYHGGHSTSPDKYGRANDNIPLHDNPHRLSPKDAEMQDHVYEAPQQNKHSGRRRVRFGELGMLGSGRKKFPFVVYFFTLVQTAVFIGELVKYASLTGSPIQTKPTFNPMIGPSAYLLVNMGARFVPCMHNVDGIQNSEYGPIPWRCPNSTSLDDSLPENKCTLSELCGFGGVPEPAYQPGTPLDTKPEPNQWFRFIVPIFLHAGLVHIGFNMLLQLTLGRDMERSIGSIRFFLVYMSAGIFGFVMGGNFAGPLIASTGASGSLFGIIALTLLDLLYSWKDRVNPVKDLAFIILDIVISFLLGLLPGLDNFSHIGGFLMGLCLGLCVLHSPNSLRRRIGAGDAPYASESVSGGFAAQGTPPSVFKNPVGFFKGRKPLWWVWWLIRAGALILVIVVFIVLLNNFYVYRTTCKWCNYLSCLVSTLLCFHHSSSTSTPA